MDSVNGPIWLYTEYLVCINWTELFVSLIDHDTSVMDSDNSFLVLEMLSDNLATVGKNLLAITIVIFIIFLMMQNGFRLQGLGMH